MSMTNTATYVTCDLPEGDTITFRVGVPTDWNTAQDRWLRLDDARIAGNLNIRYMRRSYAVRFVEVRSTDKHGRGLGSERHWNAIPVPYNPTVTL